MKDIVKATEFDYSIISRFPVLSPGKGRRSAAKKGKKYIDCVCAFDIETSRIEELEQSIMYIWQFQIDELVTVIGRTWDEYREFIKRISEEAAADIVVFIHNASYEWQFLKTVFEFLPDDVFALDNRKVLRFQSGKIEYRCSYLQSNMNLAKFTQTFNAKHQKLPDFDYDSVRYPWTELTDRELEYCVNDVRGLVEAIKEEMRRDGDNLYTIPLTSTGYVRRDVKQSVKERLPHNWLEPILPDLHLYDMLLEAFRGGNTHANRYFTNEILHNVKSCDRSSSYPDVQVNCRFPISRFSWVGQHDLRVAYFRDLMETRNRAVLLRCSFSGIRLIDRFYGCPYLSISKIRNASSVAADNGRVLQASYLETTLTDIDFRIVEDVYKWDDFKIIEMCHSRYGKLPAAITEPTKEYYRLKTSLKGSGSDEYLYMKSKNKLNSVYGMSAQRPVRFPILYQDRVLIEDRGADRQALLEKSNRHAFQSYAWGVWVTAWARYRLHEGIRLVGDSFVYCDTDSVKYLDLGGVCWDEYNNQRERDSRKNGAFAKDKNGKVHFMGVYEFDGEYYEFKTMGAKKYCYTDESGLHLTLAGVSKKKGAEELQEFGGISAFKEGTIFRKAGGTESVYNDLKEPMIIYLEGRPVELTSNIVIKPSTYTLSITTEYEQILKDAANYRKVIFDLGLR